VALNTIILTLFLKSWWDPFVNKYLTQKGNNGAFKGSLWKGDMRKFIHERFTILKASFVWKFKGLSHCVTVNKWTHMFNQTWENLDFVDFVIMTDERKDYTMYYYSSKVSPEIQYLQFRDSRFNICSSRFDIQYLQFEIRDLISAVREHKYNICSSRT
jgi:hypothetical protein